MNEPIYVIGYARVSSPKQAQNGEGLDDQEREIKLHCEKMGWKLFPQGIVFKEPYTGTKKNRPVYLQIMEILKGNKKQVNIKYFVFWDFDRLTRAGTIDYDQIWEDVKQFDVKLRDTTEIIQDEKNSFEEFGFDFEYSWAVARPSEDAERQKVEDARKERIKILHRLIKPEIRLTQDGYQIGRPDEGYVNKQIFVENKKKCIQVPDPERSLFIIKVFNLRADGLLSDKQICDELNTIGYKTPLQKRWDKSKQKVLGSIGGHQMTVKHLQAIIKRTTYCGVICEKWTKNQPIIAKYKGLVSIDTFNKANRGKIYLESISKDQLILKKNLSSLSAKRKKYNPSFPIKGVLLCDICRKSMKASFSTGKSGAKFGAYHCERNHKRVSYNQIEIEKQFFTFINKLRYTDSFIKILDRVLLFKYREQEGDLAISSSQANQHIADLELEKANLIKSFPLATMDAVRNGIEEQIAELQVKINKSKENRKTVELREEDVIEYIKSSKDLMEHPAKMLEDITSPEELQAVFSLIFEEFPTCKEIISGTPKLTLVLRINREKYTSKGLLVTLPGIEPGLPA
jgi:DNA invertase Pin-like site-specific DNA recombinase